MILNSMKQKKVHMKKFLHVLFVLVFLLAGCGAGVTTPTPIEESPTLDEAVTETPTVSPSPQAEQPLTPENGYGPTGFPADVNPLTGVKVLNSSLLDRRPLAVKVANLPRSVRPQWGLSLADIVFEHYTEEGSTRFTAIFYGSDAEIVGPIRSARFVDTHIVRGYKAVFAFGSAYSKVIERLFSAEFANRLVLEGENSPLYRFDPNGYNHLVVNTAQLSDFLTQKGVENGRQNLDGMFFHPEAPEGGQTAEQFVVRFSAAIYNRWQYDPVTGKYLRFSDTVEDFYDGERAEYAQLTDLLTGQPIAFDNVVVLFVTNEYYNREPEVIDILLLGSGSAYAFRDGQVYQVQWQRNSADAVVSLAYPDGAPFPFKPGNTWFEVIGKDSTVTETEQGLRFQHLMP
jgi:hypothetical protein